MLRASISDDFLHLEIRGTASLICMSHDQHIPLSAVTSARVTGWAEPRSEIGWRTAGGYWPGWFSTGWYSVPNRKEARQFWSVYRDRDEILVIDTTLERPSRLVLGVPNAVELANEINARLAR